MGDVPTARSRDGLMLEQRQLLTELAAGRSLSEACEIFDIPRARVQRWLSSDAKFRARFDDLFSPDNLKELQKILNLEASRAAEVYADAMAGALRDVKVDIPCPKCGTDIHTSVRVEDWRSRLHAADTLLKVSGILRERRDVKVNVTVGPIDWSRIETADLVNVLAWRTGRQLSPQVEERLRQLGVITDEGRKALPAPAAAAVDAEFREIHAQD